MNRILLKSTFNVLFIIFSVIPGMLAILAPLEDAFFHKTYGAIRQYPSKLIRNIIYAGESLGGRTAIIAGAIDDNVRIKGVLGISTAGYGDMRQPNPKVQTFINSVNSIFRSKVFLPFSSLKALL